MRRFAWRYRDVPDVPGRPETDLFLAGPSMSAERTGKVFRLAGIGDPVNSSIRLIAAAAIFQIIDKTGIFLL